MWLQSRILASQGVVHGFTTREGGTSAAPYDSLNLGSSVGDDPRCVEANGDRLAAQVGVPRRWWAAPRQVHGAEVRWATALGPSVSWSGGDPTGAETGLGAETPVADAVAAAWAPDGVVVAVRTADCVPILVADPDSGRVVAIHAGWRGLVGGVIEAGVQALDVSGRSRAGWMAAIGPSIGPCCFEVQSDVAQWFGSPVEAADRPLVRIEDGRMTVDLWEACRQRLARLGVGRIDLLGLCTSCARTEDGRWRFFSHRRESGATGRHLAFIVPPRPTPPATEGGSRAG